jgi:hypothetical protein
MAARLKRTRSSDETLMHVRRARQFAEKYGLSDAHPSEYIEPLQQLPTGFDDLLSRIK